MMEKHIICTRCSGKSPADARFCIECGESFAAATGPTARLTTVSCAGCRAENPAGARFCALCGRALPSSAGAPLPWPQPLPPRPPAPPHRAPQVHPRVHVPAPPVVSAPAPRASHTQQSQQGGMPLSLLVLIVGVGLLLFTKALLWPGIAIVAAVSFLIHKHERGRLEDGLRAVLLIGGFWLIVSNPRLWPALLLVFVGYKLLKGKRWP